MKVAFAGPEGGTIRPSDSGRERAYPFRGQRVDMWVAHLPDELPHTLEGPDDMPAHVKAALLGPSLTLPVHSGRLVVGTWQGIYLCEHRDRGGSRSAVATLWGADGG